MAALALVLAGCATLEPPEPQATDCPRLGAIRWDAWFGAKGVPGQAVERSLGPMRWHDRLPECATPLGEGRVVIACDGPAQMDREIEQAAGAGLDFWAFVTYPEADPMSLGLRTYLRSPRRQQLRFALLTELDKWGTLTTYRPFAERVAGLMKEAGYLRTRDGRPVLFLGFLSSELIDRRFGGLEGLSTMLAEFRALVQGGGAGRPFIVLLASDPARALAWFQALDADAVGAYAVADNQAVAAPYERLVQRVESFWRDTQARGLPLVPPVMTGWDRRPRVLNPVPWERSTYSEEQMSWYYRQPTTEELSRHMQRALETAGRDSRGGGLALAYAWNEFDEGGWLAPTRGTGTARLQAVGRAVHAACGSKIPRATANPP